MLFGMESTEILAVCAVLTLIFSVYYFIYRQYFQNKKTFKKIKTWILDTG